MNDYDYLIDTDLIIEHLRQRPAATAFLERLVSQSVVCFSVITAAEILVGARPEEIERTEFLLNQFVQLDLDGRMPRLAAQFRRQFGKSHGVEMADAFIAATAVVYDLVVVSYNHRHFPMQELKVICPPKGAKPAQVIRGEKQILPQTMIEESEKNDGCSRFTQRKYFHRR